jgi:hypothetical protein
MPALVSVKGSLSKFGVLKKYLKIRDLKRIPAMDYNWGVVQTMVCKFIHMFQDIN